tara:strand:- start:1755 stop:2372 length:618 start_codon:yes stop_codon:yes gene_type:complete
MGFLTLIVLFGMSIGVLAILGVTLVTHIRRRITRNSTLPDIKMTGVGWLGFGNLNSVSSRIANIGVDNPARMTCGTVVMRPTPGLRMISLGTGAFVLFLLWGPAVFQPMPGSLGAIAITAIIFYAVLHISAYEARYDDAGITAPNWLFQQKQYAWDDFITIRDNQQYLYIMKFEGGRKLSLQKHLVGIRTFLTFVSDLEAINVRT